MSVYNWPRKVSFKRSFIDLAYGHNIFINMRDKKHSLVENNVKDGSEARRVGHTRVLGHV